MARYQRDPESARRIDGRESDAKELRLRSVHRGMSGEIIGGRDQLSGEKVDVPQGDPNRSLIPPPSEGFARLRAQRPVTWDERQASHAAGEAAMRESLTPGIGKIRERAAQAGLDAASVGTAAAAPVMGGAGSVMSAAAGTAVTSQNYRAGVNAATPNPYANILARGRAAVTDEKARQDRAKQLEQFRVRSGLAKAGASASFKAPEVPAIDSGELWSANVMRRKQARTY